MTITIPDNFVELLDVAPDAVSNEVRMIVAARLFDMGRVSSGAAANLAGVPRVEFLHRLSDYGVSVLNITEEELRNETDFA